jgi:SpoVK/Ycf46/Vps4 family AAA+-type ATPase
MREIFRAETINQFLLTGNLNDFVLHKDKSSETYYSLRHYLVDVLFQPFDVVIFYDRGKGIRLAKGAEYFFKYMKIFDKFHKTRFASDANSALDMGKSLASPGLLPKSAEQALEIIDRYIHALANIRQTSSDAGIGTSCAVVIDYANFVAPKGESLYMSGATSSNLIKILNWAQDPEISGSNIATLLLSQNLTDLHDLLVDNPHSAKIHIELPDSTEIHQYLEYLTGEERDFATYCPIEIPILAEKLTGLSKFNIKSIILRALRNKESITMEYLTRLRREIIEKEAFGKLDFIESDRTLDDVAGHTEAKQWLREDFQLIKKNVVNALPMGYLIAGRIGTGKTFLVECFAGECKIPFVRLKNFREKWVGATEGNLEKIFNILHALGQVVVFVDEADQATGKRGGGDGDSGLSGRIYGMLAKEMSNTKNRGKIFWMFATSRPDMLEVDLKRQGRLDVHIPLFPPVEEQEIKDLFMAMARKLKIELSPEELPPLAFDQPVSGNEMEGLLVRAIREYELQDGETKQTLPQLIAKVLEEFRPSAHTARLDFMDLLAVKECTDDRFLPPRFRDLDMLEVDRRITELSLGAGF